LILPTGGIPLAGVWIKSSPRTEVSVSPSGPGLATDFRLFYPVSGTGWTWTPLYAVAGASDLRLAVPAASDAGEAVYLDGFALYNTPVPAADASSPDVALLPTH
jgi:hypothetical protein